MISDTYPTTHEEVQLTMKLDVPSQPLRCWSPQLGFAQDQAWQPPRQRVKRLAALEFTKRAVTEADGVWQIYVAAGDEEPEVFVIRTKLTYEVV